MSIFVGLTKMTVCEISEFGKDSSKVWQKNFNETTKDAYWQLAIFTKMANWRKWQESIEGFAKPQMR